MRWMFPLAFLLVMLQPVEAGHSPPKVFLRIFIQTTGNGLPDTQAQTIVIPPNGETIQVRMMPEVTENNLINAQLDPSSGGLHLYFDHVGQVNLDAATGINQGRIMVVMINGYVVYAPVIDEQISTGDLIIPHAMSAQTLQALQDVAAQNNKKAARL